MWHIIRKPQVEQQSDGSFVGRYPGEDWSVCGESHAAVIEELKTEGSVRARAETSNDRLIEFARRNVVDPQPGVYAEEIDDEAYVNRMFDIQRQHLE